MSLEGDDFDDDDAGSNFEDCPCRKCGKKSDTRIFLQGAIEADVHFCSPCFAHIQAELKQLRKEFKALKRTMSVDDANIIMVQRVNVLFETKMVVN